MECVVCFEGDSTLHFRTCCNHVICQVCLDDIVAHGGLCLCQQQIKVSPWESHPVLLEELTSVLLYQLQKADAWFWSTQHRDFVDMPSWEEYLSACIKSLIDYVQFLDRIDAYYRHNRYPPIHSWSFEPPGGMDYAQVYDLDTYNKWVEEGMRQVQSTSWDCLKYVRLQTPEICIKACKNNYHNIEFLKEHTYELYSTIFDDKNQALVWASSYGKVALVKCLLNDGADANTHNYLAIESALLNRHFDVMKCLLEHGAMFDYVSFT